MKDFHNLLLRLTSTMEFVLPYHHVDAFSDAPFSGNPAGVCYLMKPVDPNWMQKFASEMNLSETAFFSLNKDDSVNLRWFTPACEVDLCGHATLATAHVIWETELVSPHRPIRFVSRSGTLIAEKRQDRIVLDFPVWNNIAEPLAPGILKSLGMEAEYVGSAGNYLMIQAANENTVRNLQPDFKALKAATSKGVIVTAQSDDPEIDFISRFFGPGLGVDEDPVTGSAHCALAPFWGERLGKDKMTGFQASPRGGIVGVEWKGERVLLSGKAITVLQGVVTAPALTGVNV